MTTKLRTALAVGLLLLPLATSFAFSEGGGVYVFTPRIFAGNDPRDDGPYRAQYSGSASKEVQAELTLLGYYHGPIDGNVKPGGRTSVAIASYQRDHRLPVTGAIDGGLIASLSGH